MRLVILIILIPIVFTTSCGKKSCVDIAGIKLVLREQIGWTSSIHTKETDSGVLFSSDEGIYFVSCSEDDRSALVNFNSGGIWDVTVDSDKSHLFYKLGKDGEYSGVIIRDNQEKALVDDADGDKIIKVRK